MRRFFRLRDGNVHSFGADEFAIRASSVEVCVVGDDVALLAHHVKKNAFGCATLVRGNDVAKTENALHRVAKTSEAWRSSIRLITSHHGSPLLRGHSRCARVSKQVNENCLGRNEKQVVAGVFDQFLTIGACRGANWFHALDAKGLNDGVNGHRLACSIANTTTAEP